MKLDLRTDFAEVYGFVARRIGSFDPTKNVGPGGVDRIRMIDIGFQCDQAGWVALVFDTRPNAEPDGEWTKYIEENWFPREHWLAASESLDEISLAVVPSGGSVTEIGIGDYEQLSKLLGDMLKAVLFKAHDSGLFTALPKAERCHVGVEEFDGSHYGWPPYEERGKDDLL